MAKIRIVTEVAFDYDTETNECTPISQTVIGKSSEAKKKTTTSKKTKSENQGENPGLIREDGKLILSEEAVELLGIAPDDKVFIGYDKVGSTFKPFIGTDEKKGNKLTKTNTVSYRGKANEELALYGDTFTLSKGKHEGTFYLNGNIDETSSVNPEGIEVDEESTSDDLDVSLKLDDVQTKKITSFSFDDIELD
jgi:hypothetical protein